MKTRAKLTANSLTQLRGMTKIKSGVRAGFGGEKGGGIGGMLANVKGGGGFGGF